MTRTYEDFLPDNHFSNLFEKTTKVLSQNENVLISAIYGCGSSIFLNLFLKLCKKNNIFQNNYLYDPVSQKESLIKYISRIQKTDIERKLIIIRLFETLNQKKVILEKLHALILQGNKNCVFLVFCNHTGHIHPEYYTAVSSPFFNGRFYIGPFNKSETSHLIEINSKFYGWKTPEKNYIDIYTLSGGIPRLVKHICRNIDENHNTISDIDWFMRNPSISFQLDLLSKLTRQEKISDLVILGLLDDKRRVKSLLLEKYLEIYKSQIIEMLYPTLPNLEAKLLSLLHEKIDTVVTIDQIGDFMELNGRDFSPWAIYKLLSRLKTKINNNFKIINCKGRGYLLKKVS